MDDTGQNVQEGMQTLRAQQEQLVRGFRAVQMFPVGTKELPLPEGFERVETPRGVFHVNPGFFNKSQVRCLSAMLRENVLLGMGPYNKADVMQRHKGGEPLVVVTERTPDGVEVKAVVGTMGTVPTQLVALEATKTPGNLIAVEHPLDALAKRIGG